MAVLVAAISLVMAHLLEALMPGRVISRAGGASVERWAGRETTWWWRTSFRGWFLYASGGWGSGGVVQGQRPCVLCVRILGFAGQCPRGGRGALFASGWDQITVGGHVVEKGKPFFIAPRDPRTVASRRNRHGLKSNYIVRKVDETKINS